MKWWDGRGGRRFGAAGLVVASLILGALGACADGNTTGAAAPSGPTPASTAPSPPPTLDSSTGGTQIEFSPVADRIFALAGPRFAGLIVQEDEGRIVAYWAGEIPTAAAHYAATSPGGITVQLNDGARFTREHLSAAAERLTQSELGQQVGVSGIAAKADGSGLKINLADGLPTPAEGQAIADMADLPNDAITYIPFNPGVPLTAPGG
jgi:hypothetical protein